MSRGLALWGLASFGLGLLACSTGIDEFFGGAGGLTSGTEATQASGNTTGGTPTTSDTTTATGAPTSAETIAASTGGGPGCGNGALDPEEMCDAGNLNGHDCTEKGFVSPEGAVCTDLCLVDYTGCMAKCGNGTTERGEICDDGNDISGDGCSASCQLEGISCLAPLAFAATPGTHTITGVTNGSNNYTSNLCTQGGGASGPERVYEIRASEAGFLTLWTDTQGTDYDAILYLRSTCDMADDELLCNDNLVGLPDLVGKHVEANEVVYLFVDGFMNGSGNYKVNVDLSDGTCADPVPILTGGVSVRVLGTTTGQGDDHGGSCGGTNGNDVVYEVRRLLQGDLTVTTDATFNSATYARTMCTSSETQIDCDSPNGSLDSDIFLDNLGNTPVYVFVDVATGGSGTYDLTFSP